MFGKKTKERKSDTQNIVTDSDVDSALINAVAPLGLGFSKNCFELGEMTAMATGVVKYPSKLEVGWLGRLANVPSTAAVIEYEPADISSLIAAVSRNVKYNMGTASSATDTLSRQRAEAAVADGEEIIARIDRDGEAVGKMSLMIVPIAKSFEETERVFRKVRAEAAVMGCRVRTLSFQQKEAYKHISPSSGGSEKLRRELSRVVPLSTLVGGFPFASSGFNDKSGYYFAKDANGSLVILDTWKRGGDRTNSNFVVMGVAGVGKSAAVKHLAVSEFMMDTKIIVIDPEAEYRELAIKLGGDIVDASGSGGIINPFEIKSAPKFDDEDESKEVKGLQSHLKTLELFFQLYLREISPSEQAIIKDAVISLYNDKGIFFDTDTSKLASVQYPTFTDFYNKISELAELQTDTELKSIYKKLLLLFQDITCGVDARIWNGHTTVNPKNDFICFDTSSLQTVSDEVKRTQYFNLLTYAWNILSESREKKVMIICDEAYLMIDEKVPQSLVYLRNVMKRSRKYEGSIAIISHSVIDFLADSIKQYGQALLDIPAYKILFGTDGQNLKELVDLYDLSEAEQDLLLEKRRGRALFVAGSKRLKVNFEIPEYKFELFGKAGGR